MDIRKKLSSGASRLAAGLRAHGIPTILFRLLLSWLMISALFTANSDTPFYSPLFFSEIKLYVFIPAVLILWLILCKVSDSRFIKLLMLGTVLLYAVIGAAERTGFVFSAGLSAAVCLIIMLTDLDGLSLRLHRSVPWITAGVLTIGFTVFVGGICCLYYQNHWTPTFDFGLFSQMFYNMKETGLPLITCERDVLLSHFAVHFSPVFYLLLPFYALLPDPRTLLLMQALIVASGVIPLMLICKKHKLSDPACCAFAVIYTLYPCFAGGCFYYLHENNFLAPLVLWFIYFCERGKPAMKLVFLLLLLSVKEDAAVYAGTVTLYFLFTDKNYKCNSSMLLITVIYFVTVTYYLANYGDGVMTYRYNNYIYDGSGSLVTMLTAILKNPVFVLEECFTESKLTFILQMLIPLMFLPFAFKDPRRLILLCPFLLMNLMTDYKYQYDIGFQYCFGSGALLIYLAVLAYSDHKKPKLLLCALCSSVIIFTGLYIDRLDYINAYRDAAEQRETIDEALSMIPDNASVVSSTFFLPNLSRRDELYELERTKQTAEYYVLDLRLHTDEYSEWDYIGNGFETVYYAEGVVGVFKRK